MWADRYGSSFGSEHGGSGRCGIRGALIAKGIGRTPLVKKSASEGHRDGRLSLLEALREVICSEIAAAELPYGSVPVVAVIETGAAGRSDAILVRPTFVRPAHFERSLHFGSAGFTGSDQHLDALRVRDMVLLAEAEPELLGFPGLEEMYRRFANQLGAAQARRLWQGKFLSSNACVSGALADFGSSRALPSWHKYFDQPEERFGDELKYLEVAFDSSLRNFRKYSRIPNLGDRLERAAGALSSQIEGAFASDLIDSLGLKSAQPSTQETVATLFRNYWKSQQSILSSVEHIPTSSLPWIHRAVVCGGSGKDLNQDECIVRYLVEILNKDSSTQVADVLQRLSVWSAPREGLSFDGIAGICREAQSRFDLHSDMQRYVADVIDCALSRALRETADLPLGWRLVGQAVNAGSSVRYLQSLTGGRTAALVSGAVAGNTALVFGEKIPASATENARFPKIVWHIPCDSNAIYCGQKLFIGGIEVRLPPARFLFAPPADRWICASNH